VRRSNTAAEELTLYACVDCAAKFTVWTPHEAPAPLVSAPKKKKLRV
jgi:hypothetical protein